LFKTYSTNPNLEKNRRETEGDKLAAHYTYICRGTKNTYKKYFTKKFLPKKSLYLIFTSRAPFVVVVRIFLLFTLLSLSSHPIVLLLCSPPPIPRTIFPS